MVNTKFNKNTVYNTERKYGTLPGGNPAKWYHYIVQFLFEITTGMCGLTSFIFWFWEFEHAEINFHAVLDIHAYLMPSKFYVFIISNYSFVQNSCLTRSQQNLMRKLVLKS